MAQLFETEKRPITEADKVRLGVELANVDRELLALKAEKAAVSRAYGVRLRDLEKRSDRLSLQLSEGMIEVRFELEEVPNDATQMMVIVRRDTKQLFDTRPMTEPEREAARKRRQLDIGFDEPVSSIDDDNERDGESDRPPPRVSTTQAKPVRAKAAVKPRKPKSNGKPRVDAS